MLKGDVWTISVAGTLGGAAVWAPQTVRALADAPGQTSANWAVSAGSTMVDDAISDGVVSRAPSQNAVFDALALKASLASRDASGGYAGLTLFKLNLRNAANTLTSWFTTAATVARTWTMPDKDGTVAMISDITGTNSGTNTGDNATNSQYSGLVSNATHTGDATGSTALTVVKINGVLLSGLATGILKNTTGTGVPSIAAAGTDYQAPLVSNANIKTVGGISLLGSGDLGVIAGTYGGTGVNNSTRTLTYAGNVAFTGAYNVSFTVPGAYTYTLPGQTANIGYLEIPQNSQSAAYTLVLADSGKHILHPSADTTARIFTIPANASVAYQIGTALTFVNQASAGVLTIAITTDTMRLAGAGTTGSRTLAANGVATAIKLTSTEWIISGSNLT